MTLVKGDEMGKERRCGAPFSEGKWGRRRGGSTVPKADDTTKSGTVAEEAEGSS
jgi:hypothetical protein